MRLIDADALLDTLKFLANRNYNRKLTTSYSNAYKECMEFVRHAPTIEPTLQHVESVGEDGSALKHGHWIRSSDGAWAECSKCHASIDISMGSDLYNADGNEVEHDWCPHCGAKMDEVEE